jgi:Gpi18-like mannosyltransferase
MIKFCLGAFIITRIFYFSLILTVFLLVGKNELGSELIDESEGYFLFNFLKHFYNYDSIHFIHIAKNGYTSDYNYAFFPLFPILIRYLRFFMLPLTGFNWHDWLGGSTYFYLLSGFLLSNFFCFLNTLVLFRISFFFYRSESRARLTCLLFLVNPGTVFYISVYSENLFLLLQLVFILMCLTQQIEKNFFAFVTYIVIMMTLRSTAIFLSVFLLLPVVEIMATQKYEKDLKMNIGILFAKLYGNIKLIGKIIICLGVFYLSFFWMTNLRSRSEICYSAFIKYSKSLNYTQEKEMMNNDTIFYKYISMSLYEQEKLIDKDYYELCAKKDFSFNFYTFIQNKYWDVSFLSQYKIETLDRIILSLPMNILAFLLIFSFCRKFDFYQLKQMNIRNFLLNTQDKTKINIESHRYYTSNKCNTFNTSNTSNTCKTHLLDNSLSHIQRKSFYLCGVVNFIINVAIIVLIAHPQINNRFYTTCPIVYLYCSEEIFKYTSPKERQSKTGIFIITFFLFFSILGCIMHVGSYGFA